MKQLKAFLFTALVFLTTGAQAGIITWTSTLSGANEVPPVSSTGVGAASGTIDNVTGALTWNVFAAALSGDPVAAHFHFAPPGSNGPVIINLGVRSLVFTNGGLWTGSGNVGPLLNQFLAGNFYINIHTVKNPGGELRGQVTVVPEPGTLGLIGLGLLGLLLVRTTRE